MVPLSPTEQVPQRDSAVTEHERTSRQFLARAGSVIFSAKEEVRSTSTLKKPDKFSRKPPVKELASVCAAQEAEEMDEEERNVVHNQEEVPCSKCKKMIPLAAISTLTLNRNR